MDRPLQVQRDPPRQPPGCIPVSVDTQISTARVERSTTVVQIPQPFRPEPIDEGPKAAISAAERVLLSDRADGIAMAYAAHSISMLARDLPRARVAFKQALEENPNAATVHMLASINLCLLDRPEEALKHARQAVDLSPRDPLRHAAHLARASALFHLGRYEEAVEAARDALAVRSGFVMSHLMLIAALGQLTDLTAAHAAVTDLKALRPGLTASSEQAQLPIFTVPACAESWREGWTKAGLPQ